MPTSTPSTWHFRDSHGAFELPAPHQRTGLYFPLVNEAGLIAAVSPELHGDAKTGQNTFLLPPVSIDDLHTSRAARNFWVYVAGRGAWSATGQSAPQIAQRFVDDTAESVSLSAGFLWHTVTRTSAALNLRAESSSFVPAAEDQVELLQVTLTNLGAAPLTLTPTAAIPLYGRSADNLRDHRHVTALLHRTTVHSHGVLVCPTLSFDERGHLPNAVTYAVLGVAVEAAANGDAQSMAPESFFPEVAGFIGEGGTLDWPAAVVTNQPGVPAGAKRAGREALGGLRFQTVTLAPGESRRYIVLLAILPPGAAGSPRAATPEALLERYGTAAQFDAWRARTDAYWLRHAEALQVNTGDARFDGWLKWVSVQPVLRRLCGNSFLPYHDYGRGGRGWRDLWQDLLALLLTEAGDVSDLLWSNFAGVRLDGSNATIIGARPGEFKADRNNLPRVWMDHGAWPLLTARLYLDQTGDADFLLRPQTYFKDALTHRACQRDDAWQPDQGTAQRTAAGEVYQGTVLEHLLIQHLTAFFNVGEHNLIRLEGADWNDGLDMARQRGESAAFTALYAGNLRQLAELAGWLAALGHPSVELAVELMPLLDHLAMPVDYASPAAKRQRLADYCETCRHTLSGQKVSLSLAALATDLTAKADWLTDHLRAQEWLTDHEGYSWYNGYYDEDGQRVEGDFPGGARMTLTGQVFELMAGVATDAQAREIVRAADRHLYAAEVGGYRLNTDFGEVRLNLGRCFGFAFGHKENGAMFSHMAVMYAYALYQRGLVAEGYRVLDELYRHCQNFPVSGIYPGLPEYIGPDGRGLYTYLTGSASWYLLTLVNEVFGVRGQRGHLALTPKLRLAQFDAQGQASVQTRLAGQALTVCYFNPQHLDYGAYAIAAVELDGAAVPFRREAGAVVVDRAQLAARPPDQAHTLRVSLAQRA